MKKEYQLKLGKTYKKAKTAQSPECKIFLLEIDNPPTIDPHCVVIIKDGEDVRATCTCQGAYRGFICKHRISVLRCINNEQREELYFILRTKELSNEFGLRDAVFENSDFKDVPATEAELLRNLETVAMWLKGSKLERAMKRLDNAYEEREKAEKLLKERKEMLADLFLDESQLLSVKLRNKRNRKKITVINSPTEEGDGGGEN